MKTDLTIAAIGEDGGNQNWRHYTASLVGGNFAETEEGPHARGLWTAPYYNISMEVSQWGGARRFKLGDVITVEVIHKKEPKTNV
jgi:hypothetical protein